MFRFINPSRAIPAGEGETSVSCSRWRSAWPIQVISILCHGYLPTRDRELTLG
jgi:hypothetical protein